MPLGKLSKGQIAKGFDVLDDIEKELNANRYTKLNELSSKFYTVIPHDFGRKVPPPIRDLEQLRAKMDMLLVVYYIYRASMRKICLWGLRTTKAQTSLRICTA